MATLIEDNKLNFAIELSKSFTKVKNTNASALILLFKKTEEMEIRNVFRVLKY